MSAMDELDEYQEWLYMTWGFGSEATYQVVHEDAVRPAGLDAIQGG